MTRRALMALPFVGRLFGVRAAPPPCDFMTAMIEALPNFALYGAAEIRKSSLYVPELHEPLIGGVQYMPQQIEYRLRRRSRYPLETNLLNP